MAADLGKVSVYTIPTGLPDGVTDLYNGDVVIEATDEEYGTVCLVYDAKAGKWTSLSGSATVMDWALTPDGKQLEITINNYSLRSLSTSKATFIRSPFAGGGN